jgi:hypothetical protein
LFVQFTSVAAVSVVLDGAEPRIAGEEAARMACANQYSDGCSVEARKREEGEQRGELCEEEIRVRHSLIFDARLMCDLEI